MKTSQDLVKEVEAELNAVKAADMGLEALSAFAVEAEQQFDKGDVVKTKEALVNLTNLAQALRKAVPANVIPATAGPVGKTPKEQFIEQASDAAAESLKRMQGILGPLQEALVSISQVVEQAHQITSLGKVAKDL